jgi:hypothetical protein
LIFVLLLAIKVIIPGDIKIIKTLQENSNISQQISRQHFRHQWLQPIVSIPGIGGRSDHDPVSRQEMFNQPASDGAACPEDIR